MTSTENMSNLYQLSSRYQQLLDKNEYTPEELAELDALHESVEDGCISHAKYIRNLEAEKASVEEARKEMQMREKALAERITAQKSRLLDRMKSCNLDKITKSPLFPIIIKKNAPSVEILDAGASPSDFLREKVITSFEPDKLSIKAAIQDGETVPGCRLVTNLRIDFK